MCLLGKEIKSEKVGAGHPVITISVKLDNQGEMMNRRTFMRSAAQTGLAASMIGPSAARASTDPDAILTTADAVGMGEEATANYFSEQRLFEALGTTQLKTPTDIQVVAYNFPSWHTSPYMEKYFGKGWTEYDIMKNTRKLFPGHSMPHYPLWGYYDESDPVWAAREIDLAATYGVEAWMIDWYWHEGTQFYHEQLEKGFLKAENNKKLKFAVMWANHDWKNLYPAYSPETAAMLLPQVHTFADLQAVANYCCEHYFSQSNYLTIDHRPVFAIFDAGKLIDQLGKDGAKRGLVLFRERCAKLGFPGLHLQVSNGYGGLEGELKNFGFDSATLYGTFGWSYDRKLVGSRQPYGVNACKAFSLWTDHRAKVDVPFYPTCSVGWDDSSRYGERAAVAINRSPDQFERVVRAARHFVATQSENKLIYIGAWNEWTEDSVLLPDTLWGYSYLEALRRAIKA